MKKIHYYFKIKTNKYTGNFIRELTASCTGQYGECEIGSEQALIFAKENPELYEQFEDIILQIPDDKYYRPCKIDNSDNILIFFNKIPTPKMFEIMKNKALEYGERCDIKIHNFSFHQVTTIIKEENILIDNNMDITTKKDISTIENNSNIIKCLNIKVKKLHSDAIIPEYKTINSSGCDLHSLEKIKILSKEKVRIRTGLSFQIPNGWEAQIRSRSSLAWNNSIFIINSPATIDSDYRGEILVILYNLSDNKYIIKKGDRIGQIIFQQTMKCNFEETDELDNTIRGHGGFGSTGK